LHVQTDEQAVTHNNNFALEPCTGPAGAGIPDFDAVKLAQFGTAAERAAPNSVNILNAKRFAFHYTIFVHDLLGKVGTSGCAELPGNDFVVSLGSWANVGGHGQGNRGQQNGTLMHEFGHNLNLRHGGNENLPNCKPNYLSVMSYSRQIDNNPILNRVLDYSPNILAPLNEDNLSEPAGISGPAGRQTAYGPAPAQVAPANGPIDWNRDGDAADLNVSADINSGFGGCGVTPGQTLTGANDWGSLLYDFRQTVDFADGVHISVLEADEITVDEAVEMSPDTDADGVINLFDNCPVDPNPAQEDSDGNGIGDVCDEPEVIFVDIDIKPGSDPNSINPNSRGVIPVAILTTNGFDATTVDPLSVRFGPNGATETHNRGHIEDVDGDGDDDMLLHFRTEETGIQCGDTSVSLTGQTSDGTLIEGSDSIVTVGC
jgi:hypothetical protein